MKNYRIIFYAIFPAFIFIVVGTYFFGMAVINYNNMQLEKEKQQELCITGDNMDSAAVERIGRIDGVCRITQVYTLSCQMQLGEVVQDISIDGIAADYFDDNLIPDNSAASGLILNEAAIRLFTGESRGSDDSKEDGSQESQTEESTENIQASDHAYYEGKQVVLTINERNVTATIKKILDDSGENEEPHFYANILSIKNLQQKYELESNCTQVRIKISDAGKQDDICSKIADYGYTVENVDTETLNNWNLLQAKIDGWINASIIAFLAGIYILILKYKNIDCVVGIKN